MDNRVVLAGVVISPVVTRVTPGGIPISRFAVEHASRRPEAGFEREVRCSLVVLACGGLSGPAHALRTGQTVRIHGFLCRDHHRAGGERIVLHADAVESLPA